MNNNCNCIIGLVGLLQLQALQIIEPKMYTYYIAKMRFIMCNMNIIPSHAIKTRAYKYYLR